MKKEEYFKCKEHHHDAHEVASVAAEVNQLRSLMADKSGIDFKVTLDNMLSKDLLTQKEIVEFKSSFTYFIAFDDDC